MSTSKAFIAAVAAMIVLVACGGNDVANDATTLVSQTTKVTTTLALASTSTTVPAVTSTTTRAPAKTTTTIAAALTAPTDPATSTTTTVVVTPATPTTVVAPKVHQVTTSGFSFSPASLTIAVGDTVEFSIAGHDVQWSGTGTAYTNPYSRTFTTAGSYNYICTIHNNYSGMSGVITVR